jgi:hypothetical protein
LIERIKDLRAANSKPPLPQREPAENLEEVFLKVKTKVIKLWSSKMS